MTTVRTASPASSRRRSWLGAPYPAVWRGPFWAGLSLVAFSLGNRYL